MLSVENGKLKGGGSELKAMIWDAAVDSVREWTGQDLTTSSLYGIRVYKEGAVLAPHVDRLPLVSSAIINVAQVCVVWLERCAVLSRKEMVAFLNRPTAALQESLGLAS